METKNTFQIKVKGYGKVAHKEAVDGALRYFDVEELGNDIMFSSSHILIDGVVFQIYMFNQYI